MYFNLLYYRASTELYGTAVFLLKYIVNFKLLSLCNVSLPMHALSIQRRSQFWWTLTHFAFLSFLRRRTSKKFTLDFSYCFFVFLFNSRVVFFGYNLVTLMTVSILISFNIEHSCNHARNLQKPFTKSLQVFVHCYIFYTKL